MDFGVRAYQSRRKKSGNWWKPDEFAGFHENPETQGVWPTDAKLSRRISALWNHAIAEFSR
jgi:hypothetical protein